MINKIVNYLLFLLMILSCNSVYSKTIGNNYIDELLLFILIIKFILHITSMDFIKKNVLKSLIFLAFYFLYLLIFMGMNYINGIFGFIYLYFLIFPLFFFIFATSTKEAIKSYVSILCNIVFMITIMSFFFYIIGTILNIISPNKQFIINWGGKRIIDSYYGLHFNIQRTDLFKNHFYRNTSIFVEAPMYSLVLSLALAFQIFILGEKYNKKTITYILAIISSVSITGIICIILIFSLNIIINGKNKYIFIKMLIILILGLSLYSIIGNLFESKLSSSSAFARFDDYKAGYLAWKNHPLFGNGFKDSDSIVKYMNTIRYNNTGISNSFLTLLAQCGLYIFLFYFIGLLKSLIFGFRENERGIISLAIIITFLFITTIFHYRPIIIFLLAISYSLNLTKNNSLN